MKSRTNLSYLAKDNGTIIMSIQDVDTKKRTVDYVSNTMKVLDTQLDVTMPGCFKNSIASHGPDSDGNAKIKHALNHDLSQLPGKIIMLCEKEVNIKGVNYLALCGRTLMSDTTLGNDTLTNYLDGVYDQHSVGFKYLQYKFFNPQAHGNSAEGKEWTEFKDEIMNLGDYDELVKDVPDWYPDGKKILRVDEVKLFESSTVAFGANEFTPMLATGKSRNMDSIALKLNTRLKKLKETIKKGTQSDDMMFTIQMQIDQLDALHDQLFGLSTIKSLLDKKNNSIENQQVEGENKNSLFGHGYFL